MLSIMLVLMMMTKMVMMNKRMMMMSTWKGWWLQKTLIGPKRTRQRRAKIGRCRQSGTNYDQIFWFVSHLLLQGLVVAAVDGEGGELLLDVEDVRGEEARGDVRQRREDLGPALKKIRTVHFSEVQGCS